jgi:ketosteroid isomerase-like protein
MSAENVEFVRTAYERSNPRQAYELFHADAVWDMSHFAGWTEEPLYHGPEGILDFHRRWLEMFTEWNFNVVDVIEAGERVIGVLTQSGLGKESGAVVEMTVAQLWTIRDGKFARMEMYADPAEARAAAQPAE